MAITKLNAYLNFNGDAAQAIALYERVLGARAGDRMRMKDIPGNTAAPEHAERIMHCVLTLPGGGNAFMVADSMPSMEVTSGTNAHMALQFDNDEELLAKYDALAEGGTKLFPPHDAFFGSKFGMLVDAFGVSWMFVGPQRAASR